MIFSLVFNIRLENIQKLQNNLRIFQPHKIKRQLVFAVFIFQKNYPLLLLLSRIMQVR